MIGIITVFYSENFGSVLQAYALRKKLNNMGHEAVFISTRNKYSSHSVAKTCLSFCNKLLHLDFHNAVLSVERFFNFRKTLCEYKYIDAETINCEDFPLIIIGSDTVWDVESRYFNDSASLFWLMPIDNIRIISYAASVANSSPDKLRELGYPVTCLNNLSAISVRDSYSYEVVSKLCNKHINLSCDPTLLLDMDDYEQLFKPIYEKKYVAVYLFENISTDCVKQIKAYCKCHDYQLISIGKYLPWCDKTASPSIESFVSYIKNAEFVFTNTFHGTVFSIIFHKQFVSFGHEKKKISELLKELDLFTCLKNNQMFKYETIQEIDYSIVVEKVQHLRASSIKYIEENINYIGDFVK